MGGRYYFVNVKALIYRGFKKKPLHTFKSTSYAPGTAFSIGNINSILILPHEELRHPGVKQLPQSHRALDW